MAVSIRRSPQPFPPLIFSVALTAGAWLALAIAHAGVATNMGMALLGVAMALVGACLFLNLKGCADYMRKSIRKDAPYGYDYFRHALAEGPGGVRLPGIALVAIGVIVAGYGIAALAA